MHKRTLTPPSSSVGSLVSLLSVSSFPVLLSSFTSQHRNVEVPQFGARTCRVRQLLLLLCEEKSPNSMMFKFLEFMQCVTIMPHEFYTGITKRFTASSVCAPALFAFLALAASPTSLSN